MSTETCIGVSQGVTSGAAITSRPAKVSGIILTPAAAAATCTVYDGTSTSGTVIATLQAVASGASVGNFTCMPIEFKTAVYIAVTGTGATAQVYYSLMA